MQGIYKKYPLKICTLYQAIYSNLATETDGQTKNQRAAMEIQLCGPMFL